MKLKSKKTGIAALVLVLVVIFASLDLIVSFVTDYWWFKDLGYTQVFFKQLFTELKIAVPVFIVVTALAWFYTRTLRREYLSKMDTVEGGLSDLHIRRISIVFSVIFSAAVTYILTNTLWKDILYASHSTKFNKTDPLFGLDISFYVFKLALIRNLTALSLTLIIAFLILTFAYYLFLVTVRRPHVLEEEDVYEAEPIKEDGVFSNLFGVRQRDMHVDNSNLRTIGLIASRQLIILGVLFFLFVAVTFILKQFDLLYSDSGVVYGAGFTDVYITLNMYRLEIILAVVAAVMLAIFARKKNLKKVLLLPVIMIAVSILGTVLATGVHSLIVSPDELNKEKPFLQNNISYTQAAYDLDDVSVQSYSARGTLTAENIESNDATISNIRINDFEPSKQFYNQTQSIRTYYNFHDVDNDRYMIDGLYTQTFLSAREMVTDNLGSGVSWLSSHLKYTHGYGITLSQVDAVTETGQPEMLVSGIPPVSRTPDIQINRPEIYFGEMTDDYVITNTKELEFDYPSGDSNEYSTYEGQRGIRLTPLKRLFYTIKEGNIRILASSNINSNSKILYERNIMDRVNKLAPFLSIDNDPYIVVSDSGQLYWIMDAYTTSDNYPYSEEMDLDENTTINYVRNPIKITVNAYDGSVNFYKVSEDPIADTIGKIYPGLIKDVSEMPDGLASHIRYSNAMFDIQAKIYQKYHMNDVSVFYQKEDKWSIATDIYGQDETEMVPGYYIMKLPGMESEEFISSIAYTPNGKKNMTGLMVARCDGEHYGELILYKFPKDNVVYGPMQIESQIDQNTEISKEFSLWNSSGSTYTRGDMFVIPIDDGLLYVEPVYLESATDTSLPEVKRVIVAYRDRIAYGSSLAESLDMLFHLSDEYVEEKTPGSEGGESSTGETGSLTVSDLARLAQEAFDNSQTALQNGDWKSYGEYQEQLRQYLNQMSSAGSGTVSADVSAGANDAGADASGAEEADTMNLTEDPDL